MVAPDRYTMKLVKAADLPTLITQADNLGLVWLAESQHDRIAFYLFFDEAGKTMFLADGYGHITDQVRGIVMAYLSNGDDGRAAMTRIAELLYPPKDGE